MNWWCNNPDELIESPRPTDMKLVLIICIIDKHTCLQRSLANDHRWDIKVNIIHIVIDVHDRICRVKFEFFIGTCIVNVVRVAQESNAQCARELHVKSFGDFAGQRCNLTCLKRVSITSLKGNNDAYLSSGCISSGSDRSVATAPRVLELWIASLSHNVVLQVMEVNTCQSSICVL